MSEQPYAREQLDALEDRLVLNDQLDAYEALVQVRADAEMQRRLHSVDLDLVLESQNRAKIAEAERDALRAELACVKGEALVLEPDEHDADWWRRNTAFWAGEGQRLEAERDALDLENDSLSDRVENLELALRGARSERDALKREMEARELHHFEAEELAAALAAQLDKVHEALEDDATLDHAYDTLKSIIDADPAAVLAERDARAWDEGYTTGNRHDGRRDANPYRAGAEREATE